MAGAAVPRGRTLPEKGASVAAARGDSSATRERIVGAARELFAERGVADVSVRQIAAAAGVNHALVHRYFGSKTDMVSAILRSEIDAIASVAAATGDAPASLATAREVFSYLLTGGRTSLLLVLRAELDGLAPERLLADAPLRPLRGLVEVLAEQTATQKEADPQATAMVLGAALFGLLATAPMLAAGVGLDAEDPAALRERCLDALVALVADGGAV